MFGKENHQLEKNITQYGTFAGCFTFNHDCLNQYRLYGKENGIEGTGVALIFKNTFFSNEANLHLPVPNPDLRNLEYDAPLISNKYDEKKHPLFRCIYIDPDIEIPRVETVGHKENFLFHREKNEERIKDYNTTITEIIDIINDKMKELRELVKGLDPTIVHELLINLCYLTKHIAFKEEQECRIVRICRLDSKNSEIKVSHDFKQMYIEYHPSVLNYLVAINFGPKATGMELFQDILKLNGKNILCKKSKTPLA